MYHAIWGLQAIAVHLSRCMISNFCQMNMLNETLENTSRFIYIPKRHILDDILRRADCNLVDKIYHKRRWHHHLHNHYQFSSIKMASFADGIFKCISWNCVFVLEFWFKCHCLSLFMKLTYSATLQVMAGHRTGTEPLYETSMNRLHSYFHIQKFIFASYKQQVVTTWPVEPAWVLHVYTIFIFNFM